ncbi:ATP-dependent RNA helicase HrpA [Sinomonas notoginsengisoli]|uniref:ATP-dependent RNA helicase HrpA n=1 Tax=Sinomonas notoginsengisoli TaxID=1457311 RepID=UPI001F3AC08D|nr:ATP-dependent RNA helicase HrpA [Sinomonas notoginsengisoli]
MALTITYPASLPVSERRDELMEAIAAHQVTIIAGETGSGKTTQIPKMCLELGLDEKGLIGHTQPRRLAARTVAERIAEELGVELGQEVGFQVRFTGEVGPKTRVKLMTDGILLAEIQRDRLLKRYSTIIIDEAHERSLNIDFILGYLRRILPQRPDLKVIITSATIDPQRFARHFARELPDGSAEPAPIVEVSGRTYPVEVRYRPLVADPAGTGTEDEENASDDALEEDRDPVDAVCDAVDELSREAPGDILIFFSGEREIRDAAEALASSIQKNPRMAGAEILPLFARLSLAEQHRVFSPGGRRRIILATNVAETSLTVPGIKYVIDTGTARISRYSHRTKVQRLPIERVSQASANQRAGRCGRVSDGICIRLYSEEDYLSRPEFTDPEILRTNLAAVILQMTAMGIARGPQDVAAFPFVEPPESRAINDGVTLLRELGALADRSAGDGAKTPADAALAGRAHRRERRAGGAADGGGRGTQGGLTAVGHQLAQLPVDPRLGRMIVEAARRDCAREVMVLAAALTIQDPRERPSQETGKRQAADEKHARFKDESSDFTGYLNLWNYLQEQQRELSSSAFRRLCKAEYINYLRVREWQELFTQLRQLARPLGIAPGRGRETDPVGKHDAVHQSLLAGLLSHIGLLDERKRDYLGARGTRFAIFPGSALFKKNPTFVMAAELVETSRLWARTAATMDPAWGELVAPHLVKHSYSEPHWSKRAGSVQAFEKVTLYGVTLVAQRRINYGRVDPELARELFIRHALVEGDWNTRHHFFKRNRELLEEVDELETRVRRRGLRVDDETLFEFYDARVPADVVSERHFDAWWKKARHADEHLLDFDRALVLGEAAADTADAADAAYPTVWRQAGFDLPLAYEFHPVAPGGTPDPTDGVTAEVPVLFLNQLDPEPFRWQIPGQRVDLVTALIKSLPKQIRKNFVPAPDVARQAVAALEADFDPADDSLEESLELVLRRLKGQIIPPGSWNWDAVPPHLKMTFSVVDSTGKVLGAGKDLTALQEQLAPATRRAIADSLGATPATTSPKSPHGGPTSPEPRTTPPSTSRGGPTERSRLAESSGLTTWAVGTIPRTASTVVAGHTVTGYPALIDEGRSSRKGQLDAPRGTAGLRIFQTEEDQLRAHRGGVIRLLALRIPPPDRYVLEHLNNREKLTFSQNPHGSVAELIADCSLAAIDRLVPAELPWTSAAFDALYDEVRAELIDTVFKVTAIVEQVLASALRIGKQLKGTTSLALISALNDIKAQLEQLVYPGFVARTGYAQLEHLPRYLRAIERRLEKLPSNVQRDAVAMATVQALEDEYDDAAAALAPSGRNEARIEKVRWMIEELRVSLFAVELGTAGKVSEKRVRQALNEALAPA